MTTPTTRPRYPRTTAGIRARRAVVARMATAGLPDNEIAAELGVSTMTVLRDRRAVGVASTWKPPKTQQPHGTDARYSRDCRCDPCKAAHAARQVEYNHETGISRRYYRTCPDCGDRCYADTPTGPVQCLCQEAPELRSLIPPSEPSDTCAAPGCIATPHCRGLCRPHYQLRRRARRAAARKAKTT